MRGAPQHQGRSVAMRNRPEKRKSRMVGFKGSLTETDARDIVKYLKSLWGARALACQDPKHMQCM